MKPPIDDATLRAPGIRKRFTGRVAVDTLTFHVRRVEVFALPGPNGAGKTTTVRMLIGTTGKKQLRVTESVISAISHRAWIDGKVLEIIAYSLMSVASVAFGLLLVGVAAQFASGFVWPSAALRPTVVLMLLPHTVLGLLLWNAFFAALPATVTDMYASDQSSLMFLPILPVVLSVAVTRDPDGLIARVLSLFPLTSAPVRPVLLDPAFL